MKTLGIDLASQAKHTGVCLLEWSKGRCLCLRLEVGADNTQIIQLAKEVVRVGIDAPVGWPTSFVSLMRNEFRMTQWNDATRDRLRFRHTDFYVKECTGRWPLSVSSDLIGVVAMRCQTLLPHFRAFDETYPAAALKRWSLPSVGYKGKEGRASRQKLLQRLLQKTPWLKMAGEEKQLCEDDDNALDALVVALNARAAQLGRTEPIPEVIGHEVKTEGWIAVPLTDSLKGLASEE